MKEMRFKDEDGADCFIKVPDEHIVSASFSNELLCSMPRELTAENGAKGLLSGEFFIDVEFYDDEGNLHCRKQAIDWTTIKEIYAMAVKHLGT